VGGVSPDCIESGSIEDCRDEDHDVLVDHAGAEEVIELDHEGRGDLLPVADNEDTLSVPNLLIEDHAGLEERDGKAAELVAGEIEGDVGECVDEVGGEIGIAAEACDGLGVGDAGGAERVEGDGELEDAGAEDEVGGVDGGEGRRIGGDLGGELLGDHPGDRLEARDAGEELHGDVGMGAEALLLVGGEVEIFAGMLDEVGVEGDAAELGERGGGLEPPDGGVDELADDVTHAGDDAEGAAEGFGVGDAEDIGEDLDAGHEGFFEELFFGGDEIVLEGGGGEGFEEGLGAAGLGEEAEEVAVIDGVDGGAEFGVSGEEDADGVGGAVAGLGKQLGAAHGGHAQVGEDDGVGALALHEGEGLRAAVGEVELEVAMEDAAVAVEDRGFVIHEEEFVGHGAPRRCRALLREAGGVGREDSGGL
jgi:hypothetical protein